jgi:hypothetical protein
MIAPPHFSYLAVRDEDKITDDIPPHFKTPILSPISRRPSGVRSAAPGDPGDQRDYRIYLLHGTRIDIAGVPSREGVTIYRPSGPDDESADHIAEMRLVHAGSARIKDKLKDDDAEQYLGAVLDMTAGDLRAATLSEKRYRFLDGDLDSASGLPRFFRKIAHEMTLLVRNFQPMTITLTGVDKRRPPNVIHLDPAANAYLVIGNEPLDDLFAVGRRHASNEPAFHYEHIYDLSNEQPKDASFMPIPVSTEDDDPPKQDPPETRCIPPTIMSE